MANAEGDDDVEDGEPLENDGEAREMNDWRSPCQNRWARRTVQYDHQMDAYKSKKCHGLAVPPHIDCN